MTDPELQDSVPAPGMRQVLHDLASSLAAAAKHMHNPEVRPR